MNCIHCGKEIEDGMKLCAECESAQDACRRFAAAQIKPCQESGSAQETNVENQAKVGDGDSPKDGAEDGKNEDVSNNGQIYCRYCGKKIDRNSRFCHECGASQEIDNGKQKKGTGNSGKVFCIIGFAISVVVLSYLLYGGRPIIDEIVGFIFSAYGYKRTKGREGMSPIFAAVGMAVSIVTFILSLLFSIGSYSTVTTTRSGW